MPTATRTVTKEEVNKNTVGESMQDQARETAEAIISTTVSDWLTACSELYLDDLSRAHQQVSDFEQIARDAQFALGALVDQLDEEVHGELMDAVDTLLEAYEEAEQAITEMVDDGWGDDGYEEEVYQVMDDEVSPALEEAAQDFSAAGKACF